MAISNTIKKGIRLLKKKEYIPIPELVNENKVLVGKVALITGGSSGIGFAIAEEFLKHGGKVIISGTNESKLNVSLKKLEKIDAENVRAIVIDVRKIEELNTKVYAAAELFQENRIDILVNSAGVRNKNDFLNMTAEEYESIMDTNCKGTFFMCQQVGKFMIEHKIKGHILNITSSSALRPAWTPYQMSKWAVKGFTLGLADTLLPYGIVVNALAPGPVATPMLGLKEGDSISDPEFPAKRYAMPSEIAKLATFMVSDLGNMIIGDTFYITGGSGTISLHH